MSDNYTIKNVYCQDSIAARICRMVEEIEVEAAFRAAIAASGKGYED